MAGGINKVILIGNLGNDPEMRHTPGGAGVCEFRLATNETWTDKTGQRTERTEWHPIVVWGKEGGGPAQVTSSGGARSYLRGVSGRPRGNDKRGTCRYQPEAWANVVQFPLGTSPPPPVEVEVLNS